MTVPLQFVRFPEGGPLEAGAWVKVAEVAAWLDDNDCDELGELLRTIEDAPATEQTTWIA